MRNDYPVMHDRIIAGGPGASHCSSKDTDSGRSACRSSKRHFQPRQERYRWTCRIVPCLVSIAAGTGIHCRRVLTPPFPPATNAHEKATQHASAGLHPSRA
jgi:hypothetical protein